LETKKLFRISRLLIVAAYFLLVGGCSSTFQSDRRSAADPSSDQFALLEPQTRPQMVSEYSNHCDEGAREVQHELANCTAVPLISIPPGASLLMFDRHIALTVVKGSARTAVFDDLP
jgi:hypothetical protein